MGQRPTAVHLTQITAASLLMIATQIRILRADRISGTSFFSGLSTTFRYDYLIRMKVEYTEDFDSESRFRALEDLEVGSEVHGGTLMMVMMISHEQWSSLS